MIHDETDLRLRRALDAATPDHVDPAQVVSEVGERVVRRHRRRNRRRAAGATVVVMAVAGLAVLVVDRPQVIDTAADAPAGEAQQPTDRESTERESIPDGGTLVELPGLGPRATVVAVDPSGAWFARGDELDAGRTGPDTVSRVDRDGSVGPTTELRGAAFRGVVTDRWLWLLVDERPDLAGGSWRLKRIGRGDGALEMSSVLELDGRPADIAVEGDHVLVRDETGTVVLDHAGAVLERRAAATTTADEPELPDGMRLAGTRVELDGG